ncbi:MAG TPA: head maturation protease, ClpP-related [Acidimicrobiia bacterium]
MNQKHKSLRDIFREAVRNREGRGLNVVNVDADTAELRIYDIIGWPFIEAADVAAQLDTITAPNITVAINSPGGDVFDAVAIYNLLRQKDAKVTTRVDGIAASAASIIAQAGDRRVMVSGSQMMIHKAWTIALGDSDEMAKVAEILAKQDSIIAGIYAERSGEPKDSFSELMAEESWFDAEETVDAGLADEVVTPPRAENHVPSKFAADAEALVGAVEAFVEEAEKVVAFRSEQGKPPLSDAATAAIDEMRAALDRLPGVVAPEADEPQDPEPSNTAAVADIKRLQFEWEGRKHRRRAS